MAMAMATMLCSFSSSHHGFLTKKSSAFPALSSRFLTDFSPVACNSRGSFVRQGKIFSNSEDKISNNSSSQATPSTESSNGSNVSDKKAAARAEVEKGQTTAIITGAIAVILGVAYLVLVQLLDSRGVKLEPPPPEAFGL